MLEKNLLEGVFVQRGKSDLSCEIRTEIPADLTERGKPVWRVQHNRIGALPDKPGLRRSGPFHRFQSPDFPESSFGLLSETGSFGSSADSVSLRLERSSSVRKYSGKPGGGYFSLPERALSAFLEKRGNGGSRLRRQVATS